jgi:hypothetical protein
MVKIKTESVGAAVGKISFAGDRQHRPYKFQKASPANVPKIGHGVCDNHARIPRCLFLSAECCAGKSPALSAHFSTGDRRQHRTLIRWPDLNRTPLLTAGEKVGVCL